MTYPSDLNDAQWELTRNHFSTGNYGKSRRYSQRILISARITPGWAILAKRWVVERTLAWLGHLRRLSKDYEITIRAAENNVIIAHSIVLLRRLG